MMISSLRRLATRLALLGLLLLLSAVPLSASSYVMMSDASLVAQSPIIAEVRIEAALPPTLSDVFYTDYEIRVERLLKGSLGGSTHLLRLPGGVRWDGAVQMLYGVPRFTEDERALLFLDRRPDGYLGIVQLALGAFHERVIGGHRLAVRDLSEAAVVELGSKSTRAIDRARDFSAFSQWIADRTVGIERKVDYLRGPIADLDVDFPEARPLVGKFLLSGAKWCEFDSTPTAVTWHAHLSGLSGGTSDEFADFQNALQAWEDDPSSNIEHTYGGTTSASKGLTEKDGVNAIVWDDPNDEITGSYSCVDGGVLAIGGWKSVGTCTTGEFAIDEGDVVGQDNAACFFNGNGGKDGEEVYGHELGHALGIRHSCGDQPSGSCDGNPPGDNDALMRALSHGDGRGALLTTDDRAAANSLYGDGGLIFADGFELGDTSLWP